MIDITGSRFNGVVSYKEGEFDFTNNCGFTVVSGHNRDSLISKKTNNGAGKSVLFGMLPNVRFEQMPLADTRKKNRIHSKGSHIEIDVKNLGHNWTIRQSGSGYKIFRDGTDLEVRGQAAQREWIEKIIPLTSDEWYSYVHLQSQKKLDFMYGTSRTRMSYITDVWRLDQFDVLRRYFDKLVDDVKIAQNKADVHSKNLLNTNDALNKNGWNRHKQKELDEATEVVKSQAKKVTKLQARTQELRSLMKQVEFYSSAKSKLAKLQKKARYTKAELKEQYKFLEASEHYQEELEEYQKTAKRLNKKLAELGDVGGGKKLKKRVKELRAEIEVMEADQKRLSKVRDEHDAATRELENLDDHTEPELRSFLSRCNKQKLDPMEEMKEELGMVKTTLKLSDLLHEHDDGNCPTCMQKINLKDLEKSLKAAKKRKGILLSMIHAFEIRETRTTNKAIIEKLKFNERDFYAQKKALKKATEELETLSDKLENAVRFDEITEQMSELKKPKAPKGKVTLTLEEIEAQAEILDEIKALKERLAEFDVIPEDKGLTAELEATAAKLKKVEKKYEKAYEVSVKHGSRRAEFKLLSKQRDQISSEIEKLEPLTKKLQLYKALSKAYSNKGLKLHAMHQIVYQLEQHYNRFANLIFAEPFKFSVVAKDDGVHIIVDRGNGNVSDVRELSGAESDSFRLLHFLACVIMAKADRRVNIAILDEPDAHMDETTITLFADRYIPFLRTLVPHVFLITQKGKHVHSDCSYVTVEKHKGVSRVKLEQ